MTRDQTDSSTKNNQTPGATQQAAPEDNRCATRPWKAPLHNIEPPQVKTPRGTTSKVKTRAPCGEVVT